MINKTFLEDQTAKWQTLKINVLREYLQHLFLSSFYEQKEAEKLCFKGGTALRIIHRSPRFSEDLDFSSITSSSVMIESLIENSLIKIQNEGIIISISEAKTTSGGYLFDAETKLFGQPIDIKLNISVRKRAVGEVVMINSPFLPPYNLFSLRIEDLVEEKVQALLSRKKERDFFDLYFILRSRLGVKTVVSHKIELTETVKSYKNSLQGIKQFLPKTHRSVIKDLQKNLLTELEKLDS